MSSVWIERTSDAIPWEVWDIRPKSVRRGHSVRRYVPASELEKLRAELSALRFYKKDVEESWRFVMDERCTKDQKHCACVPVLKRELAKVQKERDEWIAKTKTAVWCDSQELKDALKENRRLRKAVEWMITAKHPDISWVNELARRAGLRWDGEAKKWRKR